ncbi:polysaccharide biosynthesis protein [Pontibacter korlensis]|uniref:Polysaccharide biosynthesis protein n=1 Tax=Pontibacter korlensis TaxID=400092 RepID=A0A0E3UXX3_9BACT|nr:polysaccharide biosynthesis protein [Pontibacter korlensis]AKD03976.1 polysaccharide biosynthesis protein [Pontibacter korlensis]
MRELAKAFSTNPKYGKVLEWGRLLTVTGSAQTIVQVTGFISGLLVIRLLPTYEYAMYTLANTMLGTMTILADGGISTGVMAQGGKVWQDREKLGVVLSTGLYLRKKFAICSLLIAIPILFFLLHRHNASLLMSVLLIVSLIPAFFSALSGTLLQIVPKLQQDVVSLQKNQIGANIGRLAMLLLTLFAFPWAFVAVLSSGLPQIWANIRLREISARYADRSQKPDADVQKEILSKVKLILPGAIYYCVSGQITIWLISIFGSTEAIAQVGALGRLTIVLNIVGTVLGTLLVPRFARLSENLRLIYTRFFQIILFLFIMSFFILSIVWLFPEQILSVLGSNYTNLTDEILLIVTGSCLALISGTIHNLNAARGIIPSPYIFIPTIIVIQILVLNSIDLSLVTHVLWFSIITFSFTCLFRTVYFVFWIRNKTL